MGLPLVQIGLDMLLDASQVAQSGEEGFMEGGVVEEELKIVSSLNGDSATVDLRERVRPIKRAY